MYFSVVVVVDTKTGKQLEVVIERLVASDFKRITKKRYFFDWKLEKDYEVYSLRILDSIDILGLVSIEWIHIELRIHIRLLSVSIENKGNDKHYENIIGNLITFVSKMAVREYAEWACVSLLPKSEITQHYINKYGMNRTGMTLSLEIREILELINTYDND